MNKIVSIACVLGGLLNSIVAQTQLQYQLNQQGSGSCAGSTVTLSVSTSVNITTAAVSEISSNAATTGGNITNDGGNPVTQRGVCWSTSPNPTTTDNITNNGNGLGSFTSNLNGLSSSTTYYLRAYAINSAGIFYGNEIVVTTPNIGSPTAHSCGVDNIHNSDLSYNYIVDQEGNLYKTVNIGTQVWMAENLKTNHFRNGDIIPNVSDSVEWKLTQLSAWCYYGNNSTYECPYGKLYNWYTVTDARNICPVGWHIPTISEVDLLNDYLGDIWVSGGKLKSTDTVYWNIQNVNATNLSGFSALPGGSRSSYPSGNPVLGPYTFNGLNQAAGFWIIDQYSSSESWGFSVKYYNGGFGKNHYYKNTGINVRCIKD